MLCGAGSSRANRPEEVQGNPNRHEHGVGLSYARSSGMEVQCVGLDVFPALQSAHAMQEHPGLSGIDMRPTCPSLR